MPVVREVQAGWKRIAGYVLAAGGVGGLGTTAAYGAQILDAVAKIPQHEARFSALEQRQSTSELNAYLTCVMVNQLVDDGQREKIKLLIAIPLTCKEPSR